VVSLEGKTLGREPPDKKFNFNLNSTDSVFNDIRNLNFGTLGAVLNQKAKVIDEYYQVCSKYF
jgi:hypothetical protein